MSAPRLSLQELVALITDDGQRQAIRRLLHEHADRLADAPGASRSHHAWPGGWQDHTEEVGNIALVQHGALSATGRRLPFSVSDAIVVLILHDIEKPWRYQQPTHPLACGSKTDRLTFRARLLEDHGITLTDAQANALRYAEGEGDDYRAGERAMGPLAAFVHACDLLSARLWPDQPAASDPWSGAQA